MGSNRTQDSNMDAIRKKMQSMKAETDDLYKKINEYETTTKESNSVSDKLDCDLRDLGKKVQKFETKMEETMEQLQLSGSKMEEAEKDFKDKDDDVNAQSRRVLLLEEECRISVEKLATIVLKLAVMSKEADNIVKDCRHWESKTMNNEVEIEELDKNLRELRMLRPVLLLLRLSYIISERTRSSWRCLRRRPGGGRRSTRSKLSR